MKKNVTATLFGVMILLNLILWFRTITLQQNIENLQQNMSNQFSHVLSEVRSISYNVASTLEAQDNIFDDSSWSFGAIDSKSMTLPMTVSVVPKESTADTVATLTINNTSVTMTRDGVHFTGVISVALFENLEVYVTLDSAGVRRSQQLVNCLPPFEERLPVLYAQNAGGSSFETYANKFTLNGPIDINLYTPENTTVTSLKIVTTDNGATIRELPLKSVLEPPVWTQMADYELSLTFEPNHTYETTVIATDSNDLTYRVIVDRQVVDNNGRVSGFGERDAWGEMVILDKNGRVLHAPMQ